MPGNSDDNRVVDDNQNEEMETDTDKPAPEKSLNSGEQPSSNNSPSKGEDDVAPAANHVSQDEQLAENKKEEDSLPSAKEESPSSKKQPISNKIVIPFSLKQEMIKTWENIVQSHLVPTVPAVWTIRKVLDVYVETKVELLTLAEQNNESSEDLERIRKRKVGWRDMVEGIAVFFDKALPSRLLYRQELPQLKALLSHPDYKNKRLSEIYGCEHLLRLLLRLPDILAECVSESKRRPILEDIKDFVQYLHNDQDKFFAATYHKFSDAELVEHKKLSAKLEHQ
jgi:mortality factor 4-like protein 1